MKITEKITKQVQDYVMDCIFNDGTTYKQLREMDDDEECDIADDYANAIDPYANHVRERVDMEVTSLIAMLKVIDADFEWTAYEEDGELHIGIRTDYSGEMLPEFLRDEEGMQFRYFVNPQVIAIGHLRIYVQYIEDKHIGKVAIITDNDEKTETEMRVVLSEPKKEYTTSQKAVAVLTDKGFKAETFPAMNDDVMLYVNTEMFILSETDVCRLANEYDNNNKI